MFPRFWVVVFTMLMMVSVLLYLISKSQREVGLAGPHVILISVDGYRYDYNQLYQAKNLRKLAESGVSASSLISVYPSSTFSNHYAMATGLYTENHGIVANHFYDSQRDEVFSMRDRDAVEDGSWYGGVPLWVLAERQGLKAATYFWVGSEADVAGVRPSYYFPYDGTTPNRQRVEQVKSWLQLPPKDRPSLITLYFSIVDSAGHQFGPNSPEVGEAIAEVDSLLGELIEFVEQLDDEVNLLVVSDHGMEQTDLDKTVAIDELVDLSEFRVMAGGSQLFLYGNDPKIIHATYRRLKAAQNHFRVYLLHEVPKRYHFSNNHRVPDILIDAEFPYLVGIGSHIGRLPKGWHGWDPQQQNMHGIFYAWGPAFKSGMTIEPFVNVHIYPLVAKVLGLEIEHEIDGSLEVLAPILNDRSKSP